MGWLHQHPWKVTLVALALVFELVVVVAARGVA